MATQQSPQALPHEVEQALGASQQYLAEIREIGTAAAALEQRDAKPAFERSNRLAHSGLGKTHRRRRAIAKQSPGSQRAGKDSPTTPRGQCSYAGPRPRTHAIAE